jgi:hypothetical protein
LKSRDVATKLISSFGDDDAFIASLCVVVVQLKFKMSSMIGPPASQLKSCVEMTEATEEI